MEQRDIFLFFNRTEQAKMFLFIYTLCWYEQRDIYESHKRKNYWSPSILVTDRSFSILMKTSNKHNILHFILQHFNLERTNTCWIPLIVQLYKIIWNKYYNETKFLIVSSNFIVWTQYTCANESFHVLNYN